MPRPRQLHKAVLLALLACAVRQRDARRALQPVRQAQAERQLTPVQELKGNPPVIGVFRALHDAHARRPVRVGAGHVQAGVGVGRILQERALRQGCVRLRARAIAAPERILRRPPLLVGAILQVEVVDEHARIGVLLREHGVHEPAFPRVRGHGVRRDLQQLALDAVEVVRAAAFAALDVVARFRVHDMEVNALGIVVQLRLIVGECAAPRHAARGQFVPFPVGAHEAAGRVQRRLLAGDAILIDQRLHIGAFGVGVLHAVGEAVVVPEEHVVEPAAPEIARRLQVPGIVRVLVEHEERIHDAARLREERLHAAAVRRALPLLLRQRLHHGPHTLGHAPGALQRLLHAKPAVGEQQRHHVLVDVVHDRLDVRMRVDAVRLQAHAPDEQRVVLRGEHAFGAGLRGRPLALEHRPDRVQRALARRRGDRIIQPGKGAMQVAQRPHIIVVVTRPAAVGLNAAGIHTAWDTDAGDNAVRVEREQPLRVAAHLALDVRAGQRAHGLRARDVQRGSVVHGNASFKGGFSGAIIPYPCADAHSPPHSP